MRWVVPSLVCLAVLVGGCRNQIAPLSRLADAGLDGGKDAGPADAGFDAGAADSGIRDSGVLVDAGTPDSGLPDSGVPDAGLPDSGPDGGPPITDAGAYQNLVSGDLNADGILDLVAGWAQSPSFYSTGDLPWVTTGFDVFYGLADGGLSSPAHYDGGADGLNFAIADLNGDGFGDVIASNVNGMSVYLSLDGGGLAPPVTYLLPSDFLVDSIAVGDLTGTKRMDLVVFGQQNGPGAIYALANDGHGAFALPVAIAFRPTHGDLPTAQLLVLDANQDGLADILAIDEGRSNLYVLLNEGDGGFAASSYFLGLNLAGPIPAWAQPMAFLPRAGGAVDLALSTWSEGTPEPWQVLVLSNRGDGTFSDGGEFRIKGLNGSGLYPGFVASADLDGDGTYDLALSGVNGRFMQVLYGTDGGGFGSPQIRTTNGNCPSGVAALGPVDFPNAVAIGDICGGGITLLDATHP